MWLVLTFSFERLPRFGLEISPDCFLKVDRLGKRIDAQDRNPKHLLHIHKECLELALVGTNGVITRKTCFIYYSISQLSGSIYKHTLCLPSFLRFLMLDYFPFFVGRTDFFIRTNVVAIFRTCRGDACKALVPKGLAILLTE